MGGDEPVSFDAMTLSRKASAAVFVTSSLRTHRPQRKKEGRENENKEEGDGGQGGRHHEKREWTNP